MNVSILASFLAFMVSSTPPGETIPLVIDPYYQPILWQEVEIIPTVPVTDFAAFQLGEAVNDQKLEQAGYHTVRVQLGKLEPDLFWVIKNYHGGGCRVVLPDVGDVIVPRTLTYGNEALGMMVLDFTGIMPKDEEPRSRVEGNIRDWVDTQNGGELKMNVETSQGWAKVYRNSQGDTWVVECTDDHCVVMLIEGSFRRKAKFSDPS